MSDFSALIFRTSMQDITIAIEKMIALQESCEHIYNKSPNNVNIQKLEKVRIGALNVYKGRTHKKNQ